MTRYAIFYTPNEGHPVTRLAASWLGRDAYSGEECARPTPEHPTEECTRSSDRTMRQSKELGRSSVSGETKDALDDFSLAELEALTEAPKRYGFHGTLKAPFRLADGKDLGDLSRGLEAFASSAVSFDLLVEVSQLGPFFALVPAAPSSKLEALAASVVRDFEPFRAPLSAAEIARRRPDNLTNAERGHLQRWGYPYVFDCFRFHMTLTGPVIEDKRQQVSRYLHQLFDDVNYQPLVIDGIALFCEPEPGAPFTIIHRWPFAGHGKTA